MIYILTCRYDILYRRICIVQIQPRNHVLDSAESTAPTQEDELLSDHMYTVSGTYLS